MRRTVLLVALTAATLVAGCSSDDQRSGPLEPPTEAVPDQQADIGLRCRDNGLIVLQLAAILSSRPPARLYQQAVVRFAAVEVALLTRQRALAQTRALALIQFLVDNRNNLINANTPATLTRLTNVVDAILCIVGLDPSGVPLGSNTGIGVVPANNQTPVIITTPQGTAGLLVPVGAAPSTDVNGNPIPGVVVTVTGGLTTPLNTPLDKYGQTVNLTASQEVEWLAGGVVVALCVNMDESIFPTVFPRLRVGHEGGLGPFFGAIEIMTPADAPDINAVVGTCGESEIIGFRSGFGRLRSLAQELFLPGELHAAALADRTGGVGGTTRKFSPFQAVDPLLSVEAVSATSQSGTAGAEAEEPPAVSVTTRLGTAIPGITVEFEVPSGPGVITPGEVTTNGSGVAATTSWLLGPGLNTVVATPQEPIDVIDDEDVPVTEINFTPTTITFTAQAGDPIEYRSTGYSFIKIGANAPSESTEDYPADEWFMPDFTPSDAWSTGGAPFGQANVNCSIFTSSPVETTWEAAAGSQANPATGSGLLVRRTFTTPGEFSGNILINVAIDNDIQVYVDGIDVTNHEDVDFVGQVNDDVVDGSWNGYIGPFQAHSGCAQQGDGTFTVPASLLDEGTTHVIAVYAHDWGGASYLDLEVELEELD